MAFFSRLISFKASSNRPAVQGAGKVSRKYAFGRKKPAAKFCYWAAPICAIAVAWDRWLVASRAAHSLTRLMRNSPSWHRQNPRILFQGNSDKVPHRLIADRESCMAKPAARVTDPTSCPMPGHGAQSIASGSSDVFFDGLAAARKGDTCTCGSALVSGVSATVFINGRPAP